MGRFSCLVVLLGLPAICLIVQSSPTTSRDGLTLNNTSEDAKLTEAQRFCLNQHGGRFSFSSSMESNGCQIKCTFWSSSSPQLDNFYNSVDIVLHNVSDNTPCKDGAGKMVCRSGVCIDKEDLPGVAVLKILNGYFPDQDLFSESDIYIEVLAQDIKERYVNLGSTSVEVDDDSPDFDTSFTSPTAYKTGSFYLRVKDRDSSPDDSVCYFYIKYTECRENQVCKTRDGRYWLNYSLKWIPQETIN